MPEVATGLELPDEDGVFAFDTYQGTPELVELTPVDLDMATKTRHGVSTLNPLAASKANLELDGGAREGSPARERSGDLSFAECDGRSRAGAGACGDGGYEQGKSGERRQAWGALRQIGLCDCARGRAPGGADCGRDQRGSDGQGYAG